MSRKKKKYDLKQCSLCYEEFESSIKLLSHKCELGNRFEVVKENFLSKGGSVMRDDLPPEDNMVVIKESPLPKLSKPAAETHILPPLPIKKHKDKDPDFETMFKERMGQIFAKDNDKTEIQHDKDKTEVIKTEVVRPKEVVSEQDRKYASLKNWLEIEIIAAVERAKDRSKVLKIEHEALEQIVVDDIRDILDAKYGKE